MIDALIADDIRPLSDGLRLVIGPVVLSGQAASRDADRLLGEQAPIVAFTELESSDESFNLIIFADEERRELYRALRKVQGIGRRSSLLVLDCGEVRDTLRAVAGKDLDYFRHIPGLGQKRIEAIIAQLAKRYERALPRALPLAAAVFVEARESLVAGGLSEDEAERRLLDLAEAVDGPIEAEALVRQASTMS